METLKSLGMGLLLSCLFATNGQGGWSVQSSQSGTGLYVYRYPSAYYGSTNWSGRAQPQYDRWDGTSNHELGVQYACAGVTGGAGVEVTCWVYSGTVTLDVWTEGDDVPLPYPQGNPARWYSGASSCYVEVYTPVHTGGDGSASSGAYQYWDDYVSAAAPTTVSWSASVIEERNEDTGTWNRQIESSVPDELGEETGDSNDYGSFTLDFTGAAYRSGWHTGSHMTMTTTYRVEAIAQVDSDYTDTSAYALSEIAYPELGIGGANQ